MFVGVGNCLPAALPHASPRLKIPMVHHWCCRVSVSREKSCSRDPGGKSARGSWCGPKRRLTPWVAYPRGLRLGRDPVMVKGIVSPFPPPPGGRSAGKVKR